MEIIAYIICILLSMHIIVSEKHRKDFEKIYHQEHTYLQDCYRDVQNDNIILAKKLDALTRNQHKIKCILEQNFIVDDVDDTES